MLGIVDYVSIFTNKFNHHHEDSTFAIKTFFYDESELFICFLPWRTNIKTAKAFGLLPTKGTVIAFESPADLINPDPIVTRRMHEEIVGAARDVIKNLVPTIEKKTIIGISTGTSCAFMLAANTKQDFERVIVVSPGSKGEEHLWKSTALQKVKTLAQARHFTKEDFARECSEINPFSTAENITCAVHVHYGWYDQFGSRADSEELITHLKKKNGAVTVVPYKRAGHILTILLARKHLS